MLLLCATAALLLALAPHRIAWIGVVGMATGALLFAFVSLPPQPSEVILPGILLSVILTAALTYLPQRFQGRSWMIAAGINAGAWSGALASASDMRRELLPAVLLSLLIVPGRWLTSRGYSIVIKVVASWMIAIASLSMFVSLMPTPGYVPDHMG